jgi:hypothetical protein
MGIVTILLCWGQLALAAPRTMSLTSALRTGDAPDVCLLTAAPLETPEDAAKPVCGDVVCEWPEDCSNCSHDCGCTSQEQCIDGYCQECIQASCYYDVECYSPCYSTGTVYCWFNKCWNEDFSACYWNAICQ